MSTARSLLYQSIYFIFSAILSTIIVLLLVLPWSVTTYEIPTSQQIAAPIIKAPKPILYEYVEVVSGCTTSISEECVQVYTGPSTDYRAVRPLRVGTILKIDLTLTSNKDIWYRVVFDEWLRYPERASERWYVQAADVRLFTHKGPQELEVPTVSTTTKKYIIVDRSDQLLYAYEGEELYMTQSVSTGLLQTPTPRGSFAIFKKTPTRYMQGPLPGISSKYYDLPGVPWNLYFTHQGAVIHGAYWHESFGKQWSNGCVNLPLESAEKLYHWAELGTPVYVRD
jgi:lipoprotein-anchoring transpeptidase ErfK/SrfK